MSEILVYLDRPDRPYIVYFGVPFSANFAIFLEMFVTQLFTICVKSQKFVVSQHLVRVIKTFNLHYKVTGYAGF